MKHLKGFHIFEAKEEQEVQVQTEPRLMPSYRIYFNAMMKKYGVSAISELKDKSVFWKDVKSGWKKGIGPSAYGKKILKEYGINESAGEDDNEYELHIKNEYSKLKRGNGAGLIDVGEINKVSNTVLANLERTYPGCEIITKDDHYFIKVK